MKNVWISVGQASRPAGGLQAPSSDPAPKEP